RKDDFFARDTVGAELSERGADATFAALEAIVDSGVQNVDPGLDSGDRRRRVAGVGGRIGLAEIGAHADGGEHQALRFAEMGLGGALGKSQGVALGGLLGGRLCHEAPWLDCGGSRLLSWPAPGCAVSRREQARRMRRYGQSFSRKKISPSRGLP